MPGFGAPGFHGTGDGLIGGQKELAGVRAPPGEAKIGSFGVGMRGGLTGDGTGGAGAAAGGGGASREGRNRRAEVGEVLGVGLVGLEA